MAVTGLSVAPTASLNLSSVFSLDICNIKVAGILANAYARYYNNYSTVLDSVGPLEANWVISSARYHFEWVDCGTMVFTGYSSGDPVRAGALKVYSADKTFVGCIYIPYAELEDTKKMNSGTLVGYSTTTGS